jgi:hypothetical protein
LEPWTVKDQESNEADKELPKTSARFNCGPFRFAVM